MNGREPFPGLTMRAVDPADAAAVVEVFRGLSPADRYRRFFSAVPDPGPLVLRHLAMVDHRDHEAFVVLDCDEIVAVASWDRRPGAGDEAEVAVVVTAAWQRRGLGRSLIRAVSADAARHDVHAIVASVLTDNGPALRLAGRQRPNDVRLNGTETEFRYAVAS
jgi:acetyltransferase